jgi:alkylated DNA repair protein (DNA oxidative demethylase)
MLHEPARYRISAAVCALDEPADPERRTGPPRDRSAERPERRATGRPSPAGYNACTRYPGSNQNEPMGTGGQGRALRAAGPRDQGRTAGSRDRHRDAGEHERIGDEAWVLRGFAAARASELLALVATIARAAPFRQMVTPGGKPMSVAMTNCGPLGWTSDRRGYRYLPVDPGSGRPWPPMPGTFAALAREAAAAAGFCGFEPDACLVNRYLPGSRLSLHQDRDEARFDAPIVSVSLGSPALFLFGGLARSDRAARITLSEGDVVVWGGVDRLRYHGVLPLKADAAPATAPLFDRASDGGCLGEGAAATAPERINLTFRKAG